MDENDWDHVVKNCGLLYGWRVDASNNEVLRATKPGTYSALQLFLKNGY